MTPADLVMVVQGWNDAHGSNEPDAPTADEYAELVKKYG